MGGVKEIDGNDMTGDTHDVRLPDGGEQGFTVKGQLNGLPRVRQMFCRVDVGQWKTENGSWIGGLPA